MTGKSVSSVCIAVMWSLLFTTINKFVVALGSKLVSVSYKKLCYQLAVVRGAIFGIYTCNFTDSTLFLNTLGRVQ